MGIKYKPSSFIIYGILVYFFLFVLSPYLYKIYSIDALFYLVVCFILLYIGTKIGEHGVRNKIVRWTVSINKKAERLIIFIMIISIIMALLYLSYVVTLSTNYVFATEDLRSALSNDRPFYTKAADMLATAGIPCFFIISYVDKLHFKYTRLLSYFSFFLPSIMILSIGARGTAIVSILILAIHILVLKKRKAKNRKYLFSKKQQIVLTISVIIIFVFILQLFDTRRSVETFHNQSIYSMNDVIYKDSYRKFNEKLGNSLDPIYGVIDYYNHSVPTFTYFYSVTKYNNNFEVYPFAYQFSFFWIILNSLNAIEFDVFDVYYANPSTGRYSTFVTGYVMDYGYFFALVMIFLSGLLLGNMWKNSQKGGKCFFIDSLILTMMLLAPIYYFWTVGSIFTILFFYFIIIFLIRKGIMIKKEVT